MEGAKQVDSAIHNRPCDSSPTRFGSDRNADFPIPFRALVEAEESAAAQFMMLSTQKKAGRAFRVTMNPVHMCFPRDRIVVKSGVSDGGFVG
jgi:hypothetical protein